MRNAKIILTAIAVALLIPSTAPSQQNQMTFFVTSVGSGNGANYGGLAGADKHCQTLAAAAGAGNRMWRAYLSTQGPNAVSAHDRIGTGPWVNVKGVQIAANVAELHGPKNNLTAETALTEKGEKPGRHDILTGSQMNGMAFTDGMDHTCNNWTSSSTGSASLGHYDRRGLSDTEQARSWNSSHPSKGCSTDDLRGTGGDGLLYCFAAK
jgi:hypothetical protein